MLSFKFVVKFACNNKLNVNNMCSLCNRFVAVQNSFAFWEKTIWRAFRVDECAEGGDEAQTHFLRQLNLTEESALINFNFACIQNVKDIAALHVFVCAAAAGGLFFILHKCCSCQRRRRCNDIESCMIHVWFDIFLKVFSNAKNITHFFFCATSYKNSASY